MLAFLAAALAGWGAWYAYSPLGAAGPDKAFVVPAGTTLKGAARDLESAGLVPDAGRLALLGRLLGYAGKVKAGNYEIRPDLTPLELLAKLTQGEVAQSAVTLIEGWTFRQARNRLDEHPDLRHDSRGLSDAQVMAALGASEASPEGLFFPDTYYFPRGSRDLDVLRRAYRAMRQRLDAEWQRRDPVVPYENAYQALIMASVIEKETGRLGERALIAGVFNNRLRLGMKLQTDPTVIYGLGAGFDGNLRRKHLETDGPYNTYTRTGLPPTPIALPGLAALQAALHPEKTRMLYFVARGDGSHHFSASLEEHNRAVARFQR